MVAARIIDLTGLAAADGFIIQGDSNGDEAGYSVSDAGDVNGDGIDDLIVGARADDSGGNNSGRAYIIFGKTGATRATIDLTTVAASDGFSIIGDTSYDLAGAAVSAAGDINGDGIDDLIVGARGGDNGGNLAGQAYVIFGMAGATRANIDLTGLPTTDGFIVQGDGVNDLAGNAVSGAGDINDDGIDDFIIAAFAGDDGGINAGEAYVIFGKSGATRPNIDLTSLSTSDGFIIQGDTDQDLTGISVSDAGDINGDGIDDLIVGAPYGDDGGVNAGEAYVIFGKAGATRANIDLTSLSASDGFIIIGDAADDYTGGSVSNAGDVNGDGIDDLIVGAKRSSDGGAMAGQAYVIYGKSGATRANIDLATLTAADGFSIVGDAASDRAGFSVSAAGDVNGDGIGDLIVGAPYGDDGGTDAGEAYVIFGRQGTTRANIDLTNLEFSDALVIRGDALGDQAGSSVSGAGDINGDGLNDLIVGARYGDDGGNRSGEAYIIYGSRLLGGITGTAAGETLAGTADADFINGVGGNDILDGGLGADTLSGGMGNDIYLVDNGGDIAIESLDQGIDRVETAIALYTLPANVENLEYFGGAAFNGTGNALDNVIVATGGADTLSGLDGNDTLGGEAGIDVLNGGNGNDRLIGGTGADSMNGGAGDDILIVDNAGDVSNGGDGIDTVQFTAIALTYTVGSDIEIVTNATGSGNGVNITLNALANTYGGGMGEDRVTAGDGADFLYGRAGNDILIGEGGNDRLFGDTGGDSLLGGDGDDLLYAGADVDQVLGGAGNDTLYGEAGNDIIRGGDGVDQLFGGSGSDRFFFTAGETGTTLATADRVRDFNQGQGDQIDLQGFDAITGGTDDAFSFIGSGAFTNVAGQLRAVVSGGQTLVSGDINGDGVADFLIRVDGVLTLGTGDFIL